MNSSHIFYDEYFKRISDNYELSNHVGILKDLIVLCTRVYREDINVQSLIKKFIEQSERTCQEHLIDRAYRFVIDFYKNPTDEQVTLLKDIYDKIIMYPRALDGYKKKEKKDFFFFTQVLIDPPSPPKKKKYKKVMHISLNFKARL